MLSDFYSPPSGAATPLWDASSGKSEGGFLSSSAAGCSLLRVNVESELGITFCGKPIGRGGNKICTQADCEVASHTHRSLPTGFPGNDVVLLIQAANGREAYCQPAILAAKLGSNLDRYLLEERSKEAWEALLTNLEKTQEVTAEEMVKFERRIEERDRDFPRGMTPMKKRAKLDLKSPSLEAGFELTMVDLMEDLGTNHDIMLSNLRDQWKLLGHNLSTLKEMHDGIRVALRNLAQGSTEEIARVDLELSPLDNRLGVQNEEAGTLSAFDLISMLWEETKRLDKIEESVGERDATWESSIISKCIEATTSKATYGQAGAKWEQEFMGKLKTELTPVLQLFTQMSSSPDKPGDIIADRLGKLEESVTKILRSTSQGGGFFKTQAPPSRSTAGLWDTVGTTERPTLDTPLGGTSSFQQGTSNDPSNLLSRLLALEQSMKDIKSNMEGERIEVAGHLFESREQTKAWLKVNAAGTGMFVHFLDPPALLNIGSNNHTSNLGVLKFEADAVKAGHTGEEEALVAASFKIEVPSIFRNDSQNREATKDSRELPGVSKFDDWDTGNGYTGARYVLLNANEDSRSRMINSASSNLTGEAFLVATTMISQSSNFWVDLSTWVSQTYRDLVGRGGQPADTWRLICQSLRKIFHELYVAREAGIGRIDASDKPAAMVWGCLQGFRRMKKILDNNIGQDPVLFHILNKHLQDNAAMKSDLAGLRDQLKQTCNRLAEAESNLSNQKKAYDKLSTSVGNLLRKSNKP